MTINKTEGRRSFRVSEAVYFKYDILCEIEFAEGLDHRNIRLGIDNGAQSVLTELNSNISQAMFALSAESAQVGRLMTLLNDKINVIVDQLPGLKKAKSLLAKLTPQTCDIAADGMVFPLADSLDIGTKLYVQFLLESDNHYVETFAKVTRVTNSPNGDENGLMFGIAIEFTGMKREQREALIQHMFSRESQTLRLRRLDLEAMQD